MQKQEKKVLSVRVSVEVIAMLNKLCEKENRSQANMIEQLIKQASKKTKD
jgi:predicted transcriptional regulator